MTPEDISFLQIGQPWPPEDQSARLERAIKNKSLFKGAHSDVYQDWIRIIREDQKATLELIINFPGAVTKLFSDLLFGEQPKFTAGEEEESEEQKWIEDFIASNKLHRQNYKAALSQSYRGEAVYKLRLEEGKDRAIAEVIPSTIWFPIVNPDNVTDIQGHVIAWVKTKKEKDKEFKYLFAEIHLPGKIYRKLWRLRDDRIAESADLAIFYNQPPAEEEDTGIEIPLVFHVPNMEVDDSPYGIDDYFECDTLFQELDVRLAQISRVLDKHTDPGMYGPDAEIETDENGNEVFRAGGKYISVPEGGTIPGYVVWDAQLEANFKYLDRILEGLYIATDTNAAAFSLLINGTIPSGAALKRLLIRPLARTNRKRLFFDDTLKDMIKAAAAFERANGRKAPEITHVDIEWQDGLPQDPMEAAQIEQIRTGNKPTSSTKSAIRRLDGGSDKSIQTELDTITEEEAANAPPPFTQTRTGGVQFGEE